MARGAGASGWGGGSGRGGAKGRREDYAVGGFAVTIQGRERIYFQAAGGEFRDLQATNDVVSNELANKLLKNGNARPISKTEMSRIKTERNKERASKPDYEMGIGVPWGNKNNREAARKSRLEGRISKRPR